MTPEQEEVCNWWAQIIGSEFAEKQLVLTNFEKSFLELFTPEQNVTALADFDFTPIKEYLERVKEERKNRPIDEKKREQEEKQKQDQYYKYCLIDGDPEKISNCLVEPPGIFRGRGEHPHAGRLKSRIVPEFVIINIGENDPIPACPIVGHTWKRVVNNKEATWLCNFKDERNEKASGKYVFLAADSKIKGENDMKKYEKAKKLVKKIDEIRRSYTEKMKSSEIEDQ